MYGLTAILPGKKVAIGETWDWKGDLLNMWKGENLRAVFTLKELVKVNGEECARITGEVIEGWPASPSPKCDVELFYSLSRKVPVKGTHRYASKSRTNTIEVSLVEPAAAKEAAR